MTTLSLTFGIICWIIINCIIAPYTCYWIYQTWTRRNLLIIKKRRPGLLAASESIFWLCVLLFSTIHDITVEFYDSAQLQRVLNAVNDFILGPLFYIFFGLSLARFWLLFFMINYSNAITKNQWKSVIHPTEAAKNWYIRNKQRYGSWRSIRKWVIVYIAVPCIIIISFRIDAIVNHENYWHYVQQNYRYSQGAENEISESELVRRITVGAMSFCLQMIFPLIFLVIMRYKTSPFSDFIGIRKEFEAKLGAALAIVKAASYIRLVGFGFGNFIQYLLGQDGDLEKLWETVSNIFSHLAQLAMVMIFSYMSLQSTKWPLQTFKSLIDAPHHQEVNPAAMIAMVQQSPKTASVQAEQPKIVQVNESVKKSVKEQMDETFLNEDLMNAFMEHLFAEYCAECLLSVIEFSQFKEFVKMKNENKSIADEKYAFEFCKSVPQSEIVFGSKSTDYRQTATELYKKYIATSAEWEINIDYATRNKYTLLFQNEQIAQNDKQNDAEFYYTLFDPCISVMIAMMTPAFSRFKRTQKYKVIQQAIMN